MSCLPVRKSPRGFHDLWGTLWKPVMGPQNLANRRTWWDTLTLSHFKETLSVPLMHFHFHRAWHLPNTFTISFFLLWNLIADPCGIQWQSPGNFAKVEDSLKKGISHFPISPWVPGSGYEYKGPGPLRWLKRKSILNWPFESIWVSKIGLLSHLPAAQTRISGKMSREENRDFILKKRKKQKTILKVYPRADSPSTCPEKSRKVPCQKGTCDFMCVQTPSEGLEYKCETSRSMLTL